jgi:hypothetical protein
VASDRRALAAVLASACRGIVGGRRRWCARAPTAMVASEGIGTGADGMGGRGAGGGERPGRARAAVGSGRGEHGGQWPERRQWWQSTRRPQCSRQVSSHAR